MSILTMIVVNLMIMVAILTISNSIAKNTKTQNQKKYEFECGFNSISNSRIPFSSQFFMIAIMFLVFDLEISIMMPIGTEECKSMPSMVSINLLLLSLTAAMFLEWITGMLEWTK